MIDIAIMTAVGTAAAKAAAGMTVRASVPAWKTTVARLRPDPKLLRHNDTWKSIKLSNKQQRTIEKYLNGRLGAGLLQILAYVASSENEDEYQHEANELGSSFVTELSERLRGPDDETSEIAKAVWQVAKSSVELHVHNLQTSESDVYTENSLFISQITSRRRGVSEQTQSGHAQTKQWPERRLNTRPAIVIERTDISSNAERYRKAISLVDEVRKSATELYGYLAMPHAREQHRIPLDEIYVPRNLRSADYDDLTQGTRAVSIHDFRDITKYAREFLEPIDVPEEDLLDSRFVVIGNPGAGKSTFIRHLVYSMSTAGTEESALAPFVLELKSYPFSRPSPIPSLIVERLRNVEHIEASAVSVRDLLTLGLGAVIFDGLDEITDLNQRRQIVETIESFARRFPLARVVVTSREEGYRGATLKPVLFSAYRLPDFTEHQVQTYVHRWFRLTAHPSDLPESLAESFLEESVHADDLRTNPLMLSLLCMLYKYEGYIPENRPRVYEECAELLFERWDKVRRVELNITSEAKSRYLIQELAYFFFTHQSSQGGVEEYVLEKVLQEYLARNVIGDIDEARTRARGFLEYCADRAWLLTKVGTSLKGERLFGFTHRTFMEYFVACYMVRQHPNPESLVKALRQQIRAGSSNVIAQIAIQRFDEAASDGMDDCLSLLLFDSRTLSDNLRADYLPFTLECLRFMTPTPYTLEKIYVATFRYFAKTRASSPLTALCAVNRGSLGALETLRRRIIAGRDYPSDDRLDLLCVVYLMTHQHASGSRMLDHAPEAEMAILESIEALPGRFVDIAGMLLADHAISLEQFLTIRPLGELFGVEISTVRGSVGSVGPFFSCFRSSLKEDKPLKYFTEMLERLFVDPDRTFPVSLKVAKASIALFELSRGNSRCWMMQKKAGHLYHLLRAMTLTVVLMLIEYGYSDTPPPVLRELAPRIANDTFMERLTLSRSREKGSSSLGVGDFQNLGLNDTWKIFLARWCENEVSVLTGSE